MMSLNQQLTDQLISLVTCGESRCLQLYTPVGWQQHCSGVPVPYGTDRLHMHNLLYPSGSTLVRSEIHMRTSGATGSHNWVPATSSTFTNADEATGGVDLWTEHWYRRVDSGEFVIPGRYSSFLDRNISCWCSDLKLVKSYVHLITVGLLEMPKEVTL